MFSNKEDRTTAIILITVIIVCVISLIAVSTIIWSIIKSPLKQITGDFGREIKLQTLDYNFKLADYTDQDEKAEEKPAEEPKKEEKKKDEKKEEQPAKEEKAEQEEPKREYDYNFTIPAKPATAILSPIEIANLQGFPDAILDDATLASSTNWQSTPQTNLRIRIPKIGIDGPVLQGQDAANLLNQGFWIYPGSYTLGKGEVVMLCHRRHFGPYDPRSCWFLDHVGINDEIFMDFNGNTLKYRVVGVNMFEANDPLIYSISPSDDYIKVVTCGPLYSNTHRLAVLAKREK
jgi:LPXTG-site transpeptidase (sortase) family protein